MPAAIIIARSPAFYNIFHLGNRQKLTSAMNFIGTEFFDHTPQPGRMVEVNAPLRHQKPLFGDYFKIFQKKIIFGVDKIR